MTVRVKRALVKEMRATRCLEAVGEGARVLRWGRSYVAVRPVSSKAESWKVTEGVGSRIVRASSSSSDSGSSCGYEVS
jgi:hypothetical protein